MIGEMSKNLPHFYREKKTIIVIYNSNQHGDEHSRFQHGTLLTSVNPLPYR